MRTVDRSLPIGISYWLSSERVPRETRVCEMRDQPFAEYGTGDLMPVVRPVCGWGRFDAKI